MEDYEAPTIVDLGSLEELTASCDAPGGGDQKFPDTSHTMQIGNPGSAIFCVSN
jgi:hypothetical protein